MLDALTAAAAGLSIKDFTERGGSATAQTDDLGIRAAGALAAVTLPSILGQGGQTTAAMLTSAAYPLGDLDERWPHAVV